MKSGARSAMVVAAIITAVLSQAAYAAAASPIGHAARSVRPPRAIPEAGSYAALSVGGPLMASTGTVVNMPAAQATPLPNVPASAWVLADAATGQVLAAKDPHGEYAPASTLKVLTAVTLIPLLNPAAMIVASQLATSAEPTSAGLVTGRAYEVADLFRALLLISANDAAVALTEATGSFAKGMALINQEAQHLQAYDVVAKLPNGLPAVGQVVSAYDEALIARQALGMPAFMAYDETLTSRLEVKPNDWETMVNQNYLLTKYPGGIGGKIGWTVSSGATYIGLARRNGVTLIVTVLHCTSQQEITSAEHLLDWGFAMTSKIKPVGELVPPLAGPPPGDAVPSTVAGLTPPAARTHHSSQRETTAALSPPWDLGSGMTGYALAAAGALVAALGLGALGWARRRAMTGQPHGDGQAPAGGS